jgi:hypothetical protein
MKKIFPCAFGALFQYLKNFQAMVHSSYLLYIKSNQLQGYLFVDLIDFPNQSPTAGE